MISSKDTLYFVLVIFMFLGLSVIKLQGERLRLAKWKNFVEIQFRVVDSVGLRIHLVFTEVQYLL